VISGRNKPSLDFVMKLLHTYNEVTIEWLIDGKGTFPKSENTPPISKISTKEITPITQEEKEIKKISADIIPELTSKKNSHKEVEKIILLYKDGSFESYNN